MPPNRERRPGTGGGASRKHIYGNTSASVHSPTDLLEQATGHRGARQRIGHDCRARQLQKAVVVTASLQLRDYQLDLVDGTRQSYRTGHRAALIQLATGADKTPVFSAVGLISSGCGVSTASRSRKARRHCVYVPNASAQTRLVPKNARSAGSSFRSVGAAAARLPDSSPAISPNSQPSAWPGYSQCPAGK
jgi:hypothetical protein